ncbi:hypothetical protein [Amycolatopsis thermoflava]|uniref:hypothetical protein n=1 Tax=Amycolatopsis thermoflava TaxID=84480 RepID=UPI0012FCCE3C|nr:hypothetical protein [Amycolatopsis thermoflava]
MTHLRDQLVRHLKQCGFVDPEDDCVPIFPTTRSVGPQVWTSANKLADAILNGGWVRVDPEDPDTVERLARSLARAEATRETGQYWTDATFNRYWSGFLGAPERERYIDHAAAALRALRGVSQHPTGKDPQ